MISLRRYSWLPACPVYFNRTVKGLQLPISRRAGLVSAVKVSESKSGDQAGNSARTTTTKDMLVNHSQRRKKCKKASSRMGARPVNRAMPTLGSQFSVGIELATQGMTVWEDYHRILLQFMKSVSSPLDHPLVLLVDGGVSDFTINIIDCVSE